jgi:hypothetical protein
MLVTRVGQTMAAPERTVLTPSDVF